MDAKMGSHFTRAAVNIPGWPNLGKMYVWETLDS